MWIVREIITLDNLLHTLLGFGLMVVMWALSGEPNWLHYARFAALMLYLREVGQVQARYYGNNFLRGWTLRGNNPDRAFHRHMEWIVPAIVINSITPIALI